MLDHARIDHVNAMIKAELRRINWVRPTKIDYTAKKVMLSFICAEENAGQ